MPEKPTIISAYLETNHLPEHDPANLDAFPAIREFIRPRLKGMGYTQESAAEAANLSTSTVSKYLSGTTRDGNIHTVGPLCRLAHFSLDKYFVIAAENADLAAEKQRHSEDVHTLIDHMERRHEQDLHARRGLIYGLLALSAMLTLLCSLLLLRDGSDLTTGLIRTVGARTASQAFILLLVLLLSLTLLRIIRIRRATFGRDSDAL